MLAAAAFDARLFLFVVHILRLNIYLQLYASRSVSIRDISGGGEGYTLRFFLVLIRGTVNQAPFQARQQNRTKSESLKKTKPKQFSIRKNIRRNLIHW